MTYTLSEYESKQLLADAGIPIPAERLVSSAEEAVKAAAAPARMMSEARARHMPPPAAGPFTAAIRRPISPMAGVRPRGTRAS